MQNTDTLLEKMQNDAPENIIIHLGESRYLVPVKIVKLLSWGLIPDMLKDENSEDAKKHPIVRTGLKRLIAPYLPQILKKTQGEEVEIKPRLNILQWLPTYAIHYAINLLASKEWQIHVKICEGCGPGVFQIVGIYPHSYGVLPSPAVATSETPDRESLPGRGQQGTSGEEDSNQLRGSMDNSGRPSVWQEHASKGITEGT
jgi:hypothetical protein